MTKKQRAQVVELLRCAYDRSRSIAMTANENDLPVRIKALAIGAREDVSEEFAMAGVSADWDYYDCCLEAAARVEEGSWP